MIKKRIYLCQGMLVYYQGTVLMVMPQEDNKPVCVGCFFSEHQTRKRNVPLIDCARHGMLCTASTRKDHHHIIFKEYIR